MANILKRGKRWRALVRRKGYPSYCKTFNTKVEAEIWAREIETHIDSNQLPTLKQVTGKAATISYLVETYREMREKSRPIRDDSTEHYTLRTLDYYLGDMDATKLTPHDLVGFCEARKDSNNPPGPYTLNMDISKLGTVMRYTAAYLRIELPDVVAQARPLLSHLQLIGGGNKRERRPSEDELHHIIVYLEENHGQIYSDVVRFAIATAMRRGEIVDLLWEDIDYKKKLVLIRNRKDPRKKNGNDQWVPLLSPAWDIINSLDKTDERIFPIHPQTISKYFKWACDANSIDDLHFHDLRHEGTSRLFEEGYQIEQVALVTGHKNWNMLRRYTQIKPESLHPSNS